MPDQPRDTPAFLAPTKRDSARCSNCRPSQAHQRCDHISLSEDGTAPDGTLIDASQVAAVIAFLASPLPVSINGESIACGGGTPGVIRY